MCFPPCALVSILWIEFWASLLLVLWFRKPCHSGDPRNILVLHDQLIKAYLVEGGAYYVLVCYVHFGFSRHHINFLRSWSLLLCGGDRGMINQSGSMSQWVCTSIFTSISVPPANEGALKGSGPMYTSQAAEAENFKLALVSRFFPQTHTQGHLPRWGRWRAVSESRKHS